MYMQIGNEYRREKNRLALFRKEWVDELTAWHDLATKLSKGQDVHIYGAKQMQDTLSAYWTKDSMNLPNSVGVFAFGPGSSDRFITSYGDYDWAKAKAFPDIEIDDGGVFRMQGILDDKLALLNRGGKVDGAAKTIDP